MEFNIQPSDIIIPEVCPYLNTPITNIRSSGYIPTNASVDRIDNSKGYIKGNIQVISRKANTMKSNATLDELEIFAFNILKLHSLAEIEYED